MSVNKELRERINKIASKPSRNLREEERSRWQVEQQDRLEVFERGVKMLKDVGAPRVLKALRKAILPEYPDAAIEDVKPRNKPQKADSDTRFFLTPDGRVGISFGWNFQESGHDEHFEGSGSRLQVLASPSNGSIVVEGIGAKVIRRKTLKDAKKGEKALIKAVATAYQYPMMYSKPRPAAI